MGRLRGWTAFALAVPAAAVAGMLLVLTLRSPAREPLVVEPSPATASAGPEVTLAQFSPESITLDVLAAGGRPGQAEVELRELGGKLLAQATVSHVGKPFQAKLTGKFNTSDPANYYVRYRLDASEPFCQRSLYFLGELLETRILGQRESLAGSNPVVRVTVRDRRGAAVPMRNAKVGLLLTHGGKEICSTEAKTDARGEAAVQLNLPAEELPGRSSR